MAVRSKAMDDLENTLPALAAPPALASPLGGAMPAEAKAKDTNRQQSDKKYQQFQDFMDVLPETALEPRIAVYRALAGTDTKADHRPERRIPMADWKEMGLKDSGALSSYLEHQLGPGYYLIEPQDSHNHRIEKIASWTQLAGYKDMNEMTEDDDFVDEIDDRGGSDGHEARGQSRDRYRRNQNRLSDVEYLNGQEDDPKARRANMLDFYTMGADEDRREIGAMKEDTNNMMTVMMMSQREDAKARREESLVREERTEREREERRRAEEQKEERRRDADKREWEARRESDKREDERRREDLQRQMDSQTRRTEMMLGAFTAAVPLIKGVMEKKDDPMVSLMVTNAMKDKATDPVMMMLLKDMMTTKQSSGGTDELIKQMGAMSSMSSKMMADQMTSMMSTSNQMTTDMMQQMYKNMLSGNGSDEDKSNWAQIVEALGSASGLVGNLLNTPPQPQAPPGAHPAQQQAIMQQQQQQAIMQQQQQVQQQKKWGELTEEERQRYLNGEVPNTGMNQQVEAPHPMQQQQAPPDQPSGVGAVGESLMSLHKMGQELSAEEQNNLVEFMITQMPTDLRVAIKSGNQESLMEICTPSFVQSPQLLSWIQEDGTVEWLDTFMPTIAVNIERLESSNIIETTDAEVVSVTDAAQPAEVAAVAQDEAEDEDSPV